MLSTGSWGSPLRVGSARPSGGLAVFPPHPRHTSPRHRLGVPNNGSGEGPGVAPASPLLPLPLTARAPLHPGGGQGGTGRLPVTRAVTRRPPAPTPPCRAEPSRRPDAAAHARSPPWPPAPRAGPAPPPQHPPPARPGPAHASHPQRRTAGSPSRTPALRPHGHTHKPHRRGAAPAR